MTPEFKEFCGGIFWNGSLTWEDAEWPQFTRCFQHTLLVWVPCFVLWITLPLNFAYMFVYRGTPVLRSPLSETKLALSAILAILSIAEVAMATRAADSYNGIVPNALFVAPSLKTATYLLTIGLFYLELKLGFITSGIQFVFWLLLVLFNIIPFYTRIFYANDLHPDFDASIGSLIVFFIEFLIILVQFMLQFVAESLPSSAYKLTAKPPCPEILASFFSRVTYWWVNGILLRGFRNTLEESDLFDLNPRDKSATTVPVFQQAWRKEINRKTVPRKQRLTRNKMKEKIITEKSPLLEDCDYGEGSSQQSPRETTEKPSIFRVMAIIYGPTLLNATFLKIIYDVMLFINPHILHLLVQYTEDRSIQEWKGYIYIVTIFASSALQSVLFHLNCHMGMTLGMRIKAAVIAAVYRKSLVMNSEAVRTSTIGEIVNLMSLDGQRIQDITGFLWMAASCPLQIILSMVFLYIALGPAAFAGLAVLLLLVPINAVLALCMRRLQVKQMKLKDARIRLMNEVLGGMKVLKLYAWEKLFQDKVTAIRNREMAILQKLAYMGAFSTFTWSTAPYVVTLVTFVTYVFASNSHHLDASKAFVSLSLFNILRLPINLLPMIISWTVQAHVSMSRVSKFLQTGELSGDTVTHDEDADNVLSIKNGTFSWDKREAHVLTNINIEIPQGKLVAVVGTVGSGKSSLIAAFLGEMEKIGGSINIKGSVAYVPQQAWIQNATLRDNVLFGSKFDRNDYNTVIDSCALRPDLAILSGGDMTEIGEKGINLSGGQKQRVSLARAVYNDADIYLLDDPLSAVDAHVGKHLYNEVIGKTGLLKDKTRILVTHGVHWLPLVDTVVVMEGGRITEMGSYEDLMKHDGAFAAFIHTYLSIDLEEENADDEPTDIKQAKAQMLERAEAMFEEIDSMSESQEKCWSSRKSLLESSAELERSLRFSISKSREQRKGIEKKRVEVKKQKLVEEERAETGQVSATENIEEDVKQVRDARRLSLCEIDFHEHAVRAMFYTRNTLKVSIHVYAAYAKAIGVIAALLLLVCFILVNVAQALANVWLSRWTEDDLLKNATLKDTKIYRKQNDFYMGIYGGLGLAQVLFVFIYSLIFAIRQVNASTVLHRDMLANIVRAPMLFFDTTPSGRIMNRFSRDIETIDNNLPMLIRQFLNTLFNVLTTIIIISVTTPLFLVVVVPLCVLYYLMQRFYISTTRQLKRLESTTRSPIYNHFTETIVGATSIRAYDVVDRFISESDKRVDNNLIYYFTGISCNRWLGVRLEFMGNILVVAAALFAVIGRNTLSGGLVGLSVSYAMQVTALLNWMVRMTSDLETNIVCVERVKEYSEIPLEADWYIAKKQPPPNWPPKGCIEFNGYSTRYRPGLDLVLKGVSCRIKGGEKVGIVGRTGAGKSSLTLALFRIIESAGGNIVIDDCTISDMGLHDLRSRLTILPQDPVLFAGSLRANLDPFNRYTDDQIWQALETANLKSYVSSLPDQLGHECEEGGNNLSLGQRQLVCLARTLLKKTKILVLDEATAAIDMETDDLIQQAIRAEFKECTVVTIAHRLNTIMDYDRVMVMDEGVIVEFDSPDNLLADETSTFYSMARDASLAP